MLQNVLLDGINSTCPHPFLERY